MFLMTAEFLELDQSNLLFAELVSVQREHKLIVEIFYIKNDQLLLTIPSPTILSLISLLLLTIDTNKCFVVSEEIRSHFYNMLLIVVHIVLLSSKTK